MISHRMALVCVSFFFGTTFWPQAFMRRVVGVGVGGLVLFRGSLWLLLSLRIFKIAESLIPFFLRFSSSQPFQRPLLSLFRFSSSAFLCGPFLRLHIQASIPSFRVFSLLQAFSCGNTFFLSFCGFLRFASFCYSAFLRGLFLWFFLFSFFLLSRSTILRLNLSVSRSWLTNQHIGKGVNKCIRSAL